MQLDPASVGWRIVDDTVMGGCSRGLVHAATEGLRFSGALSTRNNGGFSSVRGRLPQSFTGLVAARLTVRGDGRRYQLRLRETADPAAPAWRAEFPTSGASRIVELPAAAFQAVIRGCRLEILPGLRERTIRHVGLMLASREEGPFQLLLERLEFQIANRAGDG